LAYTWINVKQPYRIGVKNFTQRFLDNIFVVEAKFRTLSPVAVCSDETDVILKNNKPIVVYKHFTDNNGKPVIPASSVKGFIATYHTIAINDPNRTADLFGTMGLMSRVLFSNLKPTQFNLKIVRIGRQWPPRRRGSGVKVYLASQLLSPTNSQEIYVEAIPENIVLTTLITITNATERDLVELLASMGVHPQGNKPIRLGRAKGLGMGRIKVDELEIYKNLFIRKEQIDSKNYIAKAGELLDNEWSRIKDAFH